MEGYHPPSGGSTDVRVGGESFDELSTKTRKQTRALGLRYPEWLERGGCAAPVRLERRTA